MNLNEFKETFSKLIGSYETFILTTHENSDSDGVGAEYALYLYLEMFGKNVRMINNDKPSSQCEFLHIGNKVHTRIETLDKNAIVFMLDFNEINRIGKRLIPLLTSGNQIVRIDHHKKSEPILNCISYIDDTASSTCELVFNIIEDDLPQFPEDVKKKIALALYMGIIFDTNNFANKNVSPRTFEVCAHLNAYGADNNLAYKKLFENRKTKELQLLGLTLSGIEEFHNGKVVMYSTTQKMLQDTGLTIEVTEGFSKDVKPTNGRDVVVYIRETGKDIYRVSLRSSYRDVQKIAEHFGGGGHVLASGFRAKMKLADLKSKLLSLLK
ncbi:MAG: bifunctional oligoribonuclease/PAP phosphatase NrnA [Candidatus Celaenobacter polaris]|nr:bifunctional oligoribonuclease/PAP phosphatase NrnA [Candidatus Celaenobacter polaris]